MPVVAGRVHFPVAACIEHVHSALLTRHPEAVSSAAALERTEINKRQIEHIEERNIIALH